MFILGSLDSAQCVVDFISMLTELFSLGVMAEALRISIQKRRFRSNRISFTQNFRYKGSPHHPFFLSEIRKLG